jgi:hypothetical protein
MDCSGVLTLSRSYLAAPMMSPLSDTYREEVGSIADVLNRLVPGAISTHWFDSLGEGIELLGNANAEI